MLFNGKIAKQLLLGAAMALKSAKESHDILEKYYIEAMDFPGVSRFAFDTADKIIK